jgi:hypothetical protein
MLKSSRKQATSPAQQLIINCDDDLMKAASKARTITINDVTQAVSDDVIVIDLLELLDLSSGGFE